MLPRKKEYLPVQVRLLHARSQHACLGGGKGFQRQFIHQFQKQIDFRPVKKLRVFHHPFVQQLKGPLADGGGTWTKNEERKNNGRRTKEQRKNGRRTEEHRSITLSHQVPSSTMQWARQHGTQHFYFLNFDPVGTGLQ